MDNMAENLPNDEMCTQIYENIGDAILFLNKDREVLAANPAACKMFGRSESEICSQGLDSLMESRPAWLQNASAGNIESRERLIGKYGNTFIGDLTSIEFDLRDGSQRSALFIRDVTTRVEAEERQRNTELRYRNTLDNMIEGCQIIDRNWRYVYLNDTAVRQSHKELDELLGHTMMEVFPDIENTEMFVALRDCMEHYTACLLDNRFVFADGTSGDFELSVQPVPEGLFILSADVTKRKTAERSLRNSEENLRMFIDHAPAAVAMFDRDMRYVAVSRRFYADYGLSDADIVGRSHYDVFPEITERWKGVHRRCLAGATEKSDAEPFVRINGYVDWVKWEICPWYTPSGEIGGIILFSEVVTAQEQTKEALMASEQRWKFALEGSGDGVWDWEPRSNRMFYSPRWKSMLGYSEGEIAGTLEEVMNLVHPNQKERVDREMRQMLNGEMLQFSSEHQLLCKDGSYKWVLARGMVVARDVSGDPLRIIGTMTDISHLKSVQESLIKSNRAHRLLSSCNDRLVRASSEKTLLVDVCRIIIEQGGYAFCWVGMVQDDEKRTIIPAAQWGNGSGYLDSFYLSLDTESLAKSNNSVYRSMMSGEPMVVQEISSLPQDILWRDKAVSYGYESTIALPLLNEGIILGALIIYSLEPHAFNIEEIGIMTEMANDLAYGLAALRLRDKHRSIVQDMMVSEEKYRTLFDSASEAILMADVETRRIEFANPAVCKMLGYTLEEITKLYIKDIHPEQEYIDYVLPEFEAQLYSRKDMSLDIPFMKKDGSIVYADVNATRMMISNREVLAGFATEATQRRKTREIQEKAEKELLGAMIKTVEMISRTVEFRDPYTSGHQERVTKLADAIAREMELPENVVIGIHMAAAVHDVGKICIPSEILSKPAKLNNLEFGIVREHSQAGYDILKNVELPWPIADIILQHHERMDGSGYPNGLTGDQIMLGARIICVADVVEAMASHRPYRPAWDISAALKEITDNSGKYYDEDVVQACTRLFQKGFSLG